MHLRSLFTNWHVWLIAAAVLVAFDLAANFVNNSNQSRTAITYSEFKSQVEAGNVSQITMQGFSVTGVFKTLVTLPPPPAAPQTLAGTATVDAGLHGRFIGIHGPAQVQNFSTTIPAIGDSTLLPLLAEKHVPVDVKPVNNGPSWGGTIVASIIPILLLIGLMGFLSRRMGTGPNQIFDFGRTKARLYDKERPDVTFADVAGADQAKQELVEIADFLRAPARYGRLGGKMPKGILLVGPPGTGKTLLARAVAGEARVPFFSLSGAEFVEMLVGVGASRVRDLFSKAKANAPAIIFVDELDAVGRQRGAGLGGGNDEREQTLNQLLVEMDGFDPRLVVIVLAATNRPDVLDPALLRPGRFDRQVTLDRPDRIGRQAILEIHTRKVPLAPDVDLAVLARATPGLVGADLANLVNEATIMAVRRDAKQVSMQDFEAATDKVLIGPERTLVMDEHERRLIAYHEGGHALVALLLPKSDPVHKVSIVPHGQALGVTVQMPLDDRHNYPEDYLLSRMAVMLGGRLAVELVFGVPTTGAENDLANVTKLARQMVARWGMSSKVGRLVYSVGEEHPFLGRELAQPRDFSEEMAAIMDREMRRIVEDLYTLTGHLLRTHRSQLDRLAKALLEHETLDRRQLEALFEGELPSRVDVQEPPQWLQTGAEEADVGTNGAASRPSLGIILGLQWEGPDGASGSIAP